jgi:aconitate hydratase
MPSANPDSFHCLRALPGALETSFYSLPEAERAGAGPLSGLPFSLRVLAEHLLRHEDGAQIVADDIRALGHWVATGRSTHTVALFPRRILMQDAAGLPVLADLAALSEAVTQAGGDPDRVGARLPMDLVVDHAVEVDVFGREGAAVSNLRREFERHHSRFRFLKWAARQFKTLRIAPPGQGICHQLNLEVFAELVSTASVAPMGRLAGFDSVLGTDSHTTMINALSVFGWGVGGIEATAALLGEPVTMRIPDVIGVRLHGRLRAGVQAADLALALTARLRELDLVQRFVEFCGPAVTTLSVPDRATVANMAPEYGATMAYFPPDEQTLAYLRQTGRAEPDVACVEAFLRAQGMLFTPESPEPRFTQVIDFNLESVAATVAGPSRPQQRRSLSEVPATVPGTIVSADANDGSADGSVVIAAITSCTNTSNPRALVAAGLLARAAVERGLRPPSWVKTSLAPGSKVASQLLADSGLQDSLDALGFQVIGHGCTTCMGNSGPLDPLLEARIETGGRSVAAVLSGNRNFEGRIHPAVRLAYLASPALVIAYALAGTMLVDLSRDPLGRDRAGRQVTLSDLWPTEDAIDAAIAGIDLKTRFKDNRRSWSEGGSQWDDIQVPESDRFAWEGIAGFIRRPPFLEPSALAPQLGQDIVGARPLLVLGDGVTTDHISPVSRIGADTAAGRWLKSQGIEPSAFGSYSARRLNHDVMLRGGFANPRLQNLLTPGTAGGVTRLLPGDALVDVHEAAQAYRQQQVPVVVVAGSGYGAGSARDWAAKVTRLLGARAVIAVDFERIHRANLIAFGVLPLQLPPDTRLALDGGEELDLRGFPEALTPQGTVTLTVRTKGEQRELLLRCCIETQVEADWLRSGGVFAKVMSRAV